MDEKGEKKELQGEEKVVFKARKRLRKSSTRRPRESREEEELNDTSKLSELKLIKEAQQLRERNRQRIQESRLNADDKSTDVKEGKAENGPNEILGGLSNNFAVESSTHAFEANMEKYIEEGMKQKFGDDHEALANENKPKDISQADLYQIPRWLKIQERPMYDPSENMPATGAEEVEVSLESRLENQRKTIEAHQKLVNKKTQTELDSSLSNEITGNVRTNFVGKGSERQVQRSSSSKNRNNTEEVYAEDHVKRKRNLTATDSLLADRYRKRWRS